MPNTKTKKVASKRNGPVSRGRPRKTAKENLPTLVKVETLTLSIKVIHEEPDHTLKKIIPVVSDKEESACKLTIQPPTSPVTHPSSCSSSHPPAAIPVDESSASLPTTSASCVGFESSSSLSSLQNQNSCLDLSTGSTSVPVAKKGKSRSSVSTSQKPKSKRKVASPNHLITEYFSVITRKRKTSKDLKEEEDRHIIYHLEHDIDPISLLAIHEFETKGRGIVALRPIEKGTFICEYRGDLIQMSDAKIREAKYERQNRGCYMYYFSWNNRQWCIDATEDTGRYGRLINHSRKSPNCKSRLFIWNDTPHLVFFALTNIHEGAELLYDYGDTRRDAMVAHPWLKES